MNITTMQQFNPAELTTRTERLAYDCGKVMERIGKMKMWNSWLQEEDMYAEGAEQEKFWEDKCKEAWAAESTFNLTPEQRVEHQKKIAALRRRVVELTYEAHCASCMLWEQMEEDAEHYADEALYWTQIKEDLEWKVAQVKKEVARRRAAVEAVTAAAGGSAAEFARYSTLELSSEVADCEEERKQIAWFAQGRQMTPEEVKEMAARTDWLQKARAELARRALPDPGKMAPLPAEQSEALRVAAADAPRFQEDEQSCTGCRENQPNQLAHMDPGGCLYTEE